MVTKPVHFEWTDEKVTKAVDLMKKGYTALQISVQIDAPSRNSVIAKLHRMGFPGGGSKATSGKALNPDGKKPYWTAERERQAIELFESGLNYTEISKTFGDATPDCVGSYLRARGYKRDYTPAVRSQVNRVAALNRGAAPPPPKEGLVLPKFEQAYEPLPTSQPIKLIDSRYGLCRWPVGPTDAKRFRYCGAPSDPTKVYCDHHHQLSLPKERRTGVES